MKTSDFKTILNKHANDTVNVRSFEGRWISGVNRVPDKIASEIGAVVRLLQEQINKGQLCKKDEYLLIYNFQPLHISSTAYLCSLDMVIKPISEISETHINKGVPLQLVIDGSGGAVMNNGRGMLEMAITTLEELAQEGTPAIIYDNYNNFIENSLLAKTFKRVEDSFSQDKDDFQKTVLKVKSMPDSADTTCMLGFSKFKQLGTVKGFVESIVPLKLQALQVPKPLLFSEENKAPSPASVFYTVHAGIRRICNNLITT